MMLKDYNTSNESPPRPQIFAWQRMFVARQIARSDDVFSSLPRGVIEDANGAAKTLGVHPNTLRHRMEKLRIKRSVSLPKSPSIV